MSERDSRKTEFGTNPDTVSKHGGINPSAPTAGTEGWGSTRDEQETLSGPDAEASHPDAKGAGDIRHTSYPQNEAAQNPAAHNPEQTSKSFRCSDLGRNDCDWSVTGTTDEMLGIIQQHAREKHGKELTEEELRRAESAIRDRAA